MRIVTRAIAGAEEQRYLDTCSPPRWRAPTLVAGAIVVAAIVVAVVLAVTTLLTWVVAVLVGTDASLVVLGRGTANVWPLSMFFAGLAALAAGRLHRSAPVTAIATGTLVGMYVIDLVGKLADPVEPLRYVSAFRYYGSAIQDGIDPLAFAGAHARRHRACDRRSARCSSAATCSHEVRLSAARRSARISAMRLIERLRTLAARRRGSRGDL